MSSQVNSNKAAHANSHSSRPPVDITRDDILTQIRDDYRETKKGLEKYNTFIDRHSVLIDIIIASLMVVACLGGIIALGIGSNDPTPHQRGAAILIASMSVVLFVVAIVLIIISGPRGSNVRKMRAKMDALKKEAASYQYAVKHHIVEGDVSRDELGLFQDFSSNQEEKPKGSTGLIALGDIAILFWIIGGLTGATSPIMAIVALLSCMVSLIVAIALVASSNLSNKKPGGALLTVWIIMLIISLFVINSRIHNAEQRQIYDSTPGYHACITNSGDTGYCSN